VANTDRSSNECHPEPTHSPAAAAKKIRLSKHTHAFNQRLANPNPNTSPVKEKKENGKNKSKGKADERVADTNTDQNSEHASSRMPTTLLAERPPVRLKATMAPKKATMKISISQLTTYPIPSIHTANATTQSCTSNVFPEDSK